MAITAAMVKDLREKTGAGMMDCKKALQENGGDIDASIKFLREKGLAAAAKKAGRIAAEGLVGTFISADGIAALCEVNCETDFVAKNDDFKGLVNDLTEHDAVKAPNKVEDFLGQPFVKNDGQSVEALVNEKISTIGEKISVRRFERYDDGDAYGAYLHAGGKIGVMVKLKLADKSKANDAVSTLARDIAMHVASEAPLAIGRDDLDPKVVENEKDIFIAQAKEQGKPDNIIEKMVTGRVNKFIAASCLIDQPFIKNPDVKVKGLLKDIGGEVGTDISIAGFVRFKVGEGIEKKQDNLADEVAKMTA